MKFVEDTDTMKKPLCSMVPCQEWYWMHQDSEEAFAKHWDKKETRELLVSNGYDNNTVIKYQIDQDGLRNPLHTEADGAILALGCSFTFGIGLDINDTWPSVLGKMLNKPVYNGGIPGSSNDTAFRLADHFVPKHKLAAVVLLSPHEHRYEFYHNGFPYDYSGTAYPIWIKNNIELSTEMHNELNLKKNLLAIQCLCDKFDIPFVYKGVGNGRAGADKNDWSRDLQHFGKESHKLIASRFSKHLTFNKKTV